MKNLIVDWKDGKQVDDEIVTSPTFPLCKFVAVKDGNRYRVNADSADGVSQPICIIELWYPDLERSMAVTIAEALRQYYARLQ